MKRKKSNTFSALRYMGIAAIATPVLIIFLCIGMVVSSKTKPSAVKPQKIENVKKRQHEIVYIHKIVKVSCGRRHYDDHLNKQEIQTSLNNSTDTIK